MQNTTSHRETVLSVMRGDLAGLHYTPVQSPESIAEEVGLQVGQLAKMDANENAYGTPDEVKRAITESLAQAHIYPDPTQARLRCALSQLHPSFSPQQIVCGAGSDDILDMIMRLILPKAILISTPTFGMYSFLAKVTISRVIDVPRIAHTFQLDIDAIVKAIRENQVTLVFIPSPNNPTGNVISEEEVRRLCSERCVVVIDEAYAEFSETASLSDGPLPKEFPNLVICRTFSKWAGLAGLRIGYGLCTEEEFVVGLMKIKQPYNVSIVADAAARSALEHREKILKTVALLVDEKKRLFSELSSPAFKPYLRPVPSQANFVLCEVLETCPVTAVQLAQGLRKKGIIIRYFGTQGGALQNYIRISSSLPEHTDRVISVLKDLILSSQEKRLLEVIEDYTYEGIIFDMDGVLADVSASYRQAIILTAKHFGVEVTSEDIARAKAVGDANNDWKLTLQLIASTKPPAELPTLDQVIAKFEELYQGNEEEPGLWKKESLIVDHSLLVTLSQRFPLAIVTGRPRNPDAIRFLKDHKIDHLFKELVCMEDTEKPKPDPSPVLLALQKMNITRAIMIGDTPDDMKAAVGANIQAVGVVPPGLVADRAKEEAHLLSSGARLVLSSSLRELLLLPSP